MVVMEMKEDKRSSEIAEIPSLLPVPDFRCRFGNMALPLIGQLGYVNCWSSTSAFAGLDGDREHGCRARERI